MPIRLQGLLNVHLIMPLIKDRAAITLEEPWLTCQGDPAIVGSVCEQELSACRALLTLWGDKRLRSFYCSNKKVQLVCRYVSDWDHRYANKLQDQRWKNIQCVFLHCVMLVLHAGKSEVRVIIQLGGCSCPLTLSLLFYWCNWPMHYHLL